MRNPALAQVLKRLAAEGSAALHTGPIAEDVVRRVRQHPTAPGILSAADLAGYRPVVRESLCTDWRAYRVCGFPPPSSGHLAMMQILGVLDALGAGAPGVATDGPSSAAFLHRYTEAARLAFADRAQYVADPAFVRAPGGNWSSLLDPGYLRERASLMGEQSMKTARPGLPPGVQRLSMASQPHQPEFGTSHLSIVDGEGRALAMTTTIESAWGSRILSDGGTGLPGGFLLNNQLTDFSFAPADAQGRPVANRVEPGKRPRSSMSPTLVFDRGDGRLLMSLGSPGGAAIIHFTAKTLLGTLAFGLDAQRAIDLPNFGSFNGPTVLEKGRFDAATVEALKARSHDVQEIDMTSGLQALQRRGTGWFGGADPGARAWSEETERARYPGHGVVPAGALAWRNSRTEGYQGEVSGCSHQRQSGASGNSSRVGTPSAPARCENAVSMVTTASSSAISAAVSSKVPSSSGVSTSRGNTPGWRTGSCARGPICRLTRRTPSTWPRGNRASKGSARRRSYSFSGLPPQTRPTRLALPFGPTRRSSSSRQRSLKSSRALR